MKKEQKEQLRERCPMARLDTEGQTGAAAAQVEGGDRERYSPRNTETAFCFQLHDHLRTAWGAAHLEDDIQRIESVDSMFTNIEVQIAAWRATRKQELKAVRLRRRKRERRL